MATSLMYGFPTGEVADGGANALVPDHISRDHTFSNDINRSLAQSFSGDVVYASFLFRDDSAAVGRTPA